VSLLSVYCKRYKTYNPRSINSGLQVLRQVLPSTNERDSKATTLKKAIEYINHLESRLQELRRSEVSHGPGVSIDLTSIKGEAE